jgi:hypothetical protein
MARTSSSLALVWMAILIAVIGLAGGWQWYDGRGQRQAASADAEDAGGSRRQMPAPSPSTDDGRPSSGAGPHLGSSQKQFAEMQKTIAEPETFPVGLPVEGREGMVRSPYHDKEGGFVDVAGMPSGSKVRCPYSKKIFLVP